MKRTVTVPPTTTPVTYADVKLHCRINSDIEKSWFLNAINVATEYGQDATNLSFEAQTLSIQTFDTDLSPSPYPMLALERGPVTSIVSVVDRNGTVIDPSRYQLRHVGTIDYLYMISGVWPLTVTYTAGGSTPARAKQAILMHVAHMWSNREASTTRPQTEVAFGLDAMYGQLRSGVML